MKPHELRWKVGGLLDQCQVCPKRPTQERYVSVEQTEEICGPCSVYQEIRNLGKQLGGEVVVKKTVMTVDEYVQLHFVEKKSREEIAQLKGVTPKTIYNFKINHRKEIENARQALNITSDNEKKTSETNNIKEEKTTEISQILSELKRQLKDKTDIIAAQQLKIMELEAKLEELEFVHKACGDVELESYGLRNENKELTEQLLEVKDKVKKQEYIINLQKETIVDMREKLGTLTAQNHHLWGLVGLQAAEKNA